MPRCCYGIIGTKEELRMMGQQNGQMGRMALALEELILFDLLHDILTPYYSLNS